MISQEPTITLWVYQSVSAINHPMSVADLAHVRLVSLLVTRLSLIEVPVNFQRQVNRAAKRCGMRSYRCEFGNALGSDLSLRSALFGGWIRRPAHLLPSGDEKGLPEEWKKL